MANHWGHDEDLTIQQIQSTSSCVCRRRGFVNCLLLLLKIVRYIEVKSFSGKWSDTYADLSAKQFSKGRELGELFWLYVVERAEQDDYQIYRIQNPALKANRFMFDDGWRALAEPTPEFTKKATYGKD